MSSSSAAAAAADRVDGDGDVIARSIRSQQSQQPLHSRAHAQSSHGAVAASSKSGSGLSRKASMSDRARRMVRRKRPQQQQAVLEWHKGRVIGQGGFGTVYVGLDASNGQLVAGKEFNFDVHESRQVELLSVLEKEIRTMRDLSHPNIVKYLGADRIDNRFYIFMEYVAGGSLRSLLDEFGALQPKVVANFARQIVMGLQYLHGNGVIHRDVKAANVLVNIDGILKLADFGSAQTFDEGSGMQGTPYWMAPEVIRGGRVGWASDIWSLGCVIVEMFTGLRPFAHLDNPAKALNFIVSGVEPVTLPEQCDAVARDFLQLCFQRDPLLRPSTSQLLLHPFVLPFAPDQSVNTNHFASFSTSDRGFSQTYTASRESPGEKPLVSATQSALGDEMRSALVRMTMSHSGANPLRVSTGTSRSTTADGRPVGSSHHSSGHGVGSDGSVPKLEENAAFLVPQEDGEILVVQLAGDDGQLSDDESSSGSGHGDPTSPRGATMGDSENTNDSDASCTTQRKAQFAVLFVLLAALAVISTLLGIKS